ncbi:MAG: hypothetical protein DWQ34_00065 [Planctomycetota bacterium]|nr:MAG: hypothetical protein DWQ29_24560 [Planctomycetota bacterium]REJ98639.1 MAG: hypothetical protein DWQ34_00065 [Planctomycetota bacterium]REK26362.1 MAG: hypothetical protein DWQ41_10095 [Planctomycetota bacterium]
MLVGAGFGQFLDSHLAIMSRFAGLTGLVCYGALELVAHYRYWERQAGIQESAELRLARRLRREQRRHDDARRGRSRVRPPQAAGPTTPRRSR